MIGIVLAVAVAATTDLTVENARFRLTVGADAVVKSLVVKANGEEMLKPDEQIPLFTVTQPRPYQNEVKLIRPNRRTTYRANALRREGDRLIVGFEVIPYEAEVSLAVTDAYAIFRLEKFRFDRKFWDYLRMDVPPVESFRVLQLPVKNRRQFGDWLNCVWDERTAAAVVGSEPYTDVSHEERAGLRLLTADLHKGHHLVGGAAALIAGAGREDFLDAMDAFERDLGLPRGVQSRRNPIANASIFHFGWDICTLADAEKYLKYVRAGGFRCVTFSYGSIYDEEDLWWKIGDYRLRPEYRNGYADVKAIVDLFRRNGMTCGIHTLHPHIGHKSHYVRGGVDPRLAVKQHFTLAKPLAANGTETEVEVVERTEGAPADSDPVKVLRFGQELIHYTDYTRAPPYRFTGCRRGYCETGVRAHDRGEIGGIMDMSEYGRGAGTMHVDQRTDLQDEIADELAKLWGCGFSYVYLDGSEAVQAPFNINVALGQYRVWKKLVPEPVFGEAAAKTHFGWHMLGGANAFDGFRPEEFKEKLVAYPCAQAPHTWQDMTRVNFGWWYLTPPDDKTVGTQVDIWEYGCAKSYAWDCPATCTCDLKALESHPRAPDILAVMRRWEEVRRRQLFVGAPKEAMKDATREFHLYPNEKGECELHEWEQLETLGGKWSDFRVFAFTRNGREVVAYWHVRSKGKLKVADPVGTLAFEGLRYLETDLSRERLREIFRVAEKEEDK